MRHESEDIVLWILIEVKRLIKARWTRYYRFSVVPAVQMCGERHFSNVGEKNDFSSCELDNSHAIRRHDQHDTISNLSPILLFSEIQNFSEFGTKINQRFFDNTVSGTLHGGEMMQQVVGFHAPSTLTAPRYLSS